jgi:hypothetical protein
MPAPTQTVPVPPPHSAGPAPHEQLAEGKAPVHGLSVAQAVRVVVARQPLLSNPQVTTIELDSQ